MSYYVVFVYVRTINQLVRRTLRTSLAKGETDMDRPNHARLPATEGYSKPQLFSFCTRCNNILHLEARMCSRCGSSAVEELTLLDVASRLRSIMLDEGRSAARR